MSEEKKDTRDWVWRVAWFVLVLGILGVAAILVNNEWRVKVQARIAGEQKELLATVSGQLLGDDQNFKVLKFATRRGLIIEVHAPHTDPLKPFVLVDKLFIPDLHDGFFSLNNQATRLALVDVDEDGRLEIIAPSFDDKLSAHLNTLRLNPETRRLELVQPPKPE